MYRKSGFFPSLNVEILNPAVTARYDFKIKRFKIIPQLNVGYAYYRFFRESDQNDPMSYYGAQNAFAASAKLSVAYQLTERLSVNASCAYEHAFLEKKDLIKTYNSYNERINYLYPGVGVEIKI